MLFIQKSMDILNFCSPHVKGIAQNATITRLLFRRVLAICYDYISSFGILLRNLVSLE